MNKKLRILSLGAGVQSSTLALMAEHGDIEPIDHAIFADTRAEPKAVMDYLDWLETKVSFPIHRVSVGSLYDDQLKIKTILKGENAGKSCIRGRIPAFVLNPDGTKGMFGRKCTTDYKIVPIERKVKELIGIKRFSKKSTILVEQLIGISVDEAQREKPSRRAEIRNVFPLLDLYMTRNDCLVWMEKNGYPVPPKSACTFCPFHSDEMWEEVKQSQEWESVVYFEKELQRLAESDDMTRGVPYLHRDCVPIDQVVFKPKTNKKMHQLSMFGNECSGMCGV
jgi:3'-phosphoadenosine 5'-phosphosulfate sulfotransferase (PAPS reductase)/FAD synthetase